MLMNMLGCVSGCVPSVKFCGVKVKQRIKQNQNCAAAGREDERQRDSLEGGAFLSGGALGPGAPDLGRHGNELLEHKHRMDRSAWVNAVPDPAHTHTQATQGPSQLQQSCETSGG